MVSSACQPRFEEPEIGEVVSEGARQVTFDSAVGFDSLSHPEPGNIEAEFGHSPLNRLVLAPVLAQYEDDFVSTLSQQLDRGTEVARVAGVSEREQDPHQFGLRSAQ